MRLTLVRLISPLQTQLREEAREHEALIGVAGTCGNSRMRRWMVIHEVMTSVPADTHDDTPYPWEKGFCQDVVRSSHSTRSAYANQWRWHAAPSLSSGTACACKKFSLEKRGMKVPFMEPRERECEDKRRRHSYAQEIGDSAQAATGFPKARGKWRPLFPDLPRAWARG